jgi:hypothetical protein
VGERERLCVTWQGRRHARSGALTFNLQRLAAELANQLYKCCNVAGSFILLEVPYLLVRAQLAIDGPGTIPSSPAAECGG